MHYTSCRAAKNCAHTHTHTHTHTLSLPLSLSLTHIHTLANAIWQAAKNCHVHVHTHSRSYYMCVMTLMQYACSDTLVCISYSEIHIAQDKNGGILYYTILYYTTTGSLPGYMGTVDAGMGEERENEGWGLGNIIGPGWKPRVVGDDIRGLGAMNIPCRKLNMYQVTDRQDRLTFAHALCVRSLVFGIVRMPLLCGVLSSKNTGYEFTIVHTIPPHWTGICLLHHAPCTTAYTSLYRLAGSRWTTTLSHL